MDNEATKLFHWMSHLGEGSTRQLRVAAEALGYDRAGFDSIVLANSVRDRALRLGDIRVVDQTRWRVRPPSLVLMPGQDVAFWRGGMAPEYTSLISSYAEAYGCAIISEAPRIGYRRLFINGTVDSIECIAVEMGLPVESNPAYTASLALPKLEDTVAATPKVELPTSGDYSVYDFDVFEWSEVQHLPIDAATSAVRYRGRFGLTGYYVCVKGELFKVDSPDDAIYLAAPKAMLCQYDSGTRKLNARVRLPYRYAVPLCLCSGSMPSRSADGGHRYANVPPDIADLVLSRLGQKQSSPSIHWLTERE